jgi:hypothetical protein
LAHGDDLTCRAFVEALGGLPDWWDRPGRAAALTAHLEACLACRRYARTYGLSIRMARAVLLAPGPPAGRATSVPVLDPLRDDS